jgi:REase_DpnII-MboI
MTKTEAIRRLEKQLKEIDRVRSDDSLLNKWRRDTEVAIEHVFGEHTRHIKDFQSIQYTPRVFDLTGPGPAPAFARARQSGLDRARAILQSMIDEVQEYWTTDRAVTASSESALSRVERLFQRFHAVPVQIRSRHGRRRTLDVRDEYDVQDLLHALLLLDFDDVRPEEWTPSYAGGAARLDFLLKDHSIVIEVKKTRRGLTAKAIGDQLIIDIKRYQQHPDCRALVCFIYDPEGPLGNPVPLERDLTGTHDSIEVIVITGPRLF